MGNAVYMSMDIPDVFLAVGLSLLFLSLIQPIIIIACAIVFQDSQLPGSHLRQVGCFFGIPWHMDVGHIPCSCGSLLTWLCGRYFRHYLNIVMLWSVWYEFDLIP